MSWCPSREVALIQNFYLKHTREGNKNKIEGYFISRQNISIDYIIGYESAPSGTNNIPRGTLYIQ